MNTLPKPTANGVAADLTQTAMLVRCVINRWDAVRLDKRASREVAQTYGTDEDMGGYEKYLVHPDTLKPLQQIADRIRAEHYKRTAPWLDGGARVLSSDGYFDYMRVARELVAEFNDEKAVFLAKYPAYKDQAKMKLGGLYDPTEYPTVGELDRKFAVNHRITPFPSAADFRVKMGAEERALATRMIEDEVKAGLAVAMAEVWGTLQKVVGRMVERLAAYNADGDKVTGIFRDSLVQNVREFVALAPTLNVARDPAFDLFVEKVREKLLVHDAQTLRDSIAARQSIQREAAKIQAAMADFVA